jgi:hypothetical protein
VPRFLLVLCRKQLAEIVKTQRAARRRNESVFTQSQQGEKRMAKLALVYGMRLFPADDLDAVEEATVKLKNGGSWRVTMHLIEGSKEEIEKTLRQSLEAFFEMYPEI